MGKYKVMNNTYNIYCDESCHLENDGKRYMVLGAVRCPLDKACEIAVKIREIKSKHGVSVHRELESLGSENLMLKQFLKISS